MMLVTHSVRLSYSGGKAHRKAGAHRFSGVKRLLTSVMVVRSYKVLRGAPALRAAAGGSGVRARPHPPCPDLIANGSNLPTQHSRRLVLGGVVGVGVERGLRRRLLERALGRRSGVERGRGGLGDVEGGGHAGGLERGLLEARRGDGRRGAERRRVVARRLRLGGGGGGGLLLLADLLGVAVEEQVDHHVPGVRGRDGAAHLQHHAAEDVVQAADRVLALVVGRDGDVDVRHRRVGVAERNGGEVLVGRLVDGLVVGARVREHEEARLLERLGVDVVGVRAGRVAAGDGRRAGVLRELHHRALAVRARRLDDDVGGVLDRHEHAGGHHELVPGLGQVNHVDAILAALVRVALHLEVAVLRAEVALRGEHHVHILLLLRKRHGCDSSVDTCDSPNVVLSSG
mmetsp:Transcript_12243/g.51554  ORF Transcript_12243/g.51554 Transcript_12243/m.51554 type:complete len:400 (-) Transcript_12243:75-1274(-)